MAFYFPPPDTCRLEACQKFLASSALDIQDRSKTTFLFSSPCHSLLEYTQARPQITGTSSVLLPNQLQQDITAPSQAQLTRENCYKSAKPLQTSRLPVRTISQTHCSVGLRAKTSVPVCVAANQLRQQPKVAKPKPETKVCRRPISYEEWLRKQCHSEGLSKVTKTRDVMKPLSTGPLHNRYNMQSAPYLQPSTVKTGSKMMHVDFNSQNNARGRLKVKPTTVICARTDVNPKAAQPLLGPPGTMLRGVKKMRLGEDLQPASLKAASLISQAKPRSFLQRNKENLAKKKRERLERLERTRVKETKSTQFVARPMPRGMDWNFVTKEVLHGIHAYHHD